MCRLPVGSSILFDFDHGAGRSVGLEAGFVFFWGVLATRFVNVQHLGCEVGGTELVFHVLFHVRGHGGSDVLGSGTGFAGVVGGAREVALESCGDMLALI